MLTKKQIKIHKKWKKANVKISRELRDIIHGYIMSDGYVDESGCLQVDQSKDQENFVLWLYEKLEPIRTSSPIKDVIRTDKRGNPKTYSKRFFTKALLKGFRSMWYKSSVNPNGKVQNSKCLPKSINCFFNSILITLWFAGDGTKIIGQRGAKFEVTAFTVDERVRLQKLFKQKFNIIVKIQKAGFATSSSQNKSPTPQWTIVISADQYEKFKQVITQMDLIPKLFPNKLCR